MAVGLVMLASLWYVQAPPRSAGAYRERAADAADALRSQVQTTRIWLRTVARDESTRQAASVGFREAEEDAAAVAAAFEGYDPPSETDALRQAVSRAGDRTVASLAEVRIAAHRGEWQALPRRRDALAELARRLDELEQQAQP